QGKTYFVTRTNPAGYTSTQAIVGSGSNATHTKVSSDQIKVVLANQTGPYSSGNEFLAQQRNASIAGHVYNDLNGNGSLDSGEPGIQNVTVTLSGGTPASGGTTTTDANGNYS